MYQLGCLHWNIAGHKPASQVNVVPAAAAQWLKAVLRNCLDFWKCAVPALKQSCCLLSGKVQYLVHGKEELVIHTSWTNSTFSSLPDPPHPTPHTQKKKKQEKLQCDCGRGKGHFKESTPLCELHTSSLSAGSWKCRVAPRLHYQQ